MFDKTIRVIDLDYTKGDRNISIHVEGETINEAEILFSFVLSRLEIIEKRGK